MPQNRARRVPASSTNDAAKSASENAKIDDLAHDTTDGSEQYLTTNQGVRINDDHNSLKAGDRGPTLLEDFILREKITHFDHERIPERIVHARGNGAHGYFQPYKSQSKVTRAAFLQDPDVQTPVFVRFSTVAGSRGSTDLARDVRGFAIKFYTSEGNFDLVGNNMPVFFIQDAMKFPDLVHAVKPEPHNEIPQAASAHDTFWDFISMTPESAHMIMWAMSDRAIPRSLRMMQGFGVHTFRFVNAEGESTFVKFHLTPKLGLKAVLWDEALKISGADPDFHRRDLWEAIEQGDFPEWEVGVQLIPEADEQKYDFDLLDPTKIVPEELVPVTPIGKLVLNRNPDNFFAEVEQAAFHIGHIVPGIDFTNDPLLQGRLFSYTDTQLIRLGGPNFHEIPINRPIAPVHNNQRDGFMRQTINRGKTAYSPNNLGGNDPKQATMKSAGFATFAERISASKVRARSKSFTDHFSQAAMFFHSQTDVEKRHIVNALRFELGKVESKLVRERILFMLSQINDGLAQDVATGLGMQVPRNVDGPLNANVGADGDVASMQPKKFTGTPIDSPALSMIKRTPPGMETAQVAALVADGFDAAALDAIRAAVVKAGGKLKIVAPHGGEVKSADGAAMPVDFSLNTVASVLFDAVYVAGGKASAEAMAEIPDAVDFVEEAYRHCKAIAATGAGVDFLNGTKAKTSMAKHDDAILVGDDSAAKKVAGDFVKAISLHRNWDRELVTKPRQP